MNASAELWLISDFPIDAAQLAEVRKLYGEDTSDADLQFRSDRRICGWPLRPPYEGGTVSDTYFLVYLCAGFLKQRRKVVDKLHALGCNLELSIRIPELPKYFSIASATMGQLAELDVQLSLQKERVTEELQNDE